MDVPQVASSHPALSKLDSVLPDLESLYKDVHSHPELSMEEERTSALAADRLRAAGYEVTTGVGKTGVVGLLRNGDGPTVMLRADMDALPVEEATGLPYASKVTAQDGEGKTVPVSHMCGHDITSLAGGRHRATGSGQGDVARDLDGGLPAGEETAQGARAMIDDGLFERFPRPEVCSAST
jgi:hippurate hydrolase